MWTDLDHQPTTDRRQRAHTEQPLILRAPDHLPILAGLGGCFLLVWSAPRLPLLLLLLLVRSAPASAPAARLAWPSPMPTSRRLAEAKPAGSNAEAAANPRDQDDILQSKQGEAATQEQSRAEQSRTGGSICDREPTPSARPYLFQSRSSSSQVRAHRPTRAAVAVVPTLPLPLYHHVYRRYVENPAAPVRISSSQIFCQTYKDCQAYKDFQSNHFILVLLIKLT